MKKNKPTALKNSRDVQKNPDKKIDQDFPGYPHGHSAEHIINPTTDAEEKTAAINNKNEKSNPPNVTSK